MTECIVSCLCSGYNASGNSSLVSLERLIYPASNERQIISRCIVNCGDSTQRYCNEQRIKLASVSCIIITSLAPHNLSGFPGIFLALSDLGVGSLMVIGPTGLQSTLDLMLPFTNRKYPVLNVLEVDHFTTAEKLVVRTDYFTVRVRPIAVSESNNKVIAVAAAIIPMPSGQAEKVGALSMVSVFPLAGYFETFPSLRAMVNDSVAEVIQEHGTVSSKMFLFTPLAVSSFDIHTDYETSPDLDKGQFGELLALCREHKAKGLFTSGNISKNAFECGYSQRMISILNSLCKPLFPETVLNQANTLPSGQPRSGYDVHLRLAAPGLSIVAPVGTGKNSKVPLLFTESNFCMDDSAAADIVEKSAVAINLYQNKVLPKLSEVLLPPKVLMSSAPPLPPPPPPFPPPMPPSFMLTYGFNGFAPDNNVFLPPQPPAFRPPVPSWPSENQLSLADLEPPSPLCLEDRGMSICLSALPSLGDISAVSSPSPQTNFAAASMLRANILQKRKQQDRNGFLDTCESTPRDGTEDGWTHRSSEALESARSLLSDPMNPYNYAEQEDDDGVRVSPMKSLRLNDSSKHFTFNTSDFSSSLKKTSPVQKTVAGKDAPMAKDQPLTVAATEKSSAFARAVFHVPPPNPFMDVCQLAFLGTGSATPSKYRNGSCIMLTLHGGQAQRKASFSDFLSIDTGSLSAGGDSVPSNAATSKPIMLLDVGEGTAAQIFQSVNCDIERFDQVLLNIRVIWISHHHADHITGLPMLIEHIKRAKMRQEALSKGASEGEGRDAGRNSLRRVPTFTKYDMRSMYTSGGYEAGKVMIIGSESVLKYFEFSCCIAGLDDLVSFTPIVSTLYAGATKEIAAATDGIITRLRSIPVQHCHSSYGLVLDFKSTHKIVYSGDCRPSQSLVKAGIDCDLLIHEATFDDSKQDDAVKKRHSTSSEARRISMQMRAKHTILTHFSQRYPLEVSNALGDLALLSSETAGSAALVGGASGLVTEAAVAYDFLRFSFPSQVAVLPRVTAALGAVLTAVEAERKALSAAAAGDYSRRF